MNKYIEQVKAEIENYKKLLNNVPNWKMEDFKEYYLSRVPKMLETLSNGIPKETAEIMLDDEISQRLATDIEKQSVDVQDLIQEEIDKSELFISHYDICCQEYGKEIDISSKEDIDVLWINSIYTVLRVRKVNLSILCDSENNNLVFKKNMFGKWYTCNMFVNGTGFYELTPSKVNFYPSINESPIEVGPFDSQIKKISFLLNNTIIQYSKEGMYLFNETKRKIMIDDFNDYRINNNNDLERFFGTLTGISTAIIYKNIKLKETEVETTVAYLINIEDGTIQTDIVDIFSGKRYEVDNTIPQKDAINKVYETVLIDLEQKNNYNSRHILVPKNRQQE